MLLISTRSHFKSIFKGPVFWAHQREQLADEGRLLEDRTHTDKFSGSTWSVWSSSTNTTPWEPCSPRHVPAGQWWNSLLSFPSPLSPSHQNTCSWICFLLAKKKKKTQERDSKGSLTSLHAVRTSLAKLGCLTSWLQHNRWIYPRCTEPNILPQTGASSKCWLGV